MSSKDESFDYIVVGAGSAGCVVANRLVSAGHSVCLIEAGPADSSPLIHIPFGIIGLIREGRHNWGYNTEPDPQLNNRRLYWPRGKTLGGSSSINAMVYIRGNPADYNEWADAGNEGWGWKDILPVFTSLEHNERGADAWHGDSG
jgi:choline dehydrogenase